jgi:2-polyprenyl-3-methyl-5-hydroxy-6-metoxy-1,4-benzoquinol methylase
MKGKRIQYYFDYAANCEMCGATTDDHLVLGQRLNQSQGLMPKRKNGITTTVMKCVHCGLVYANPQPIPYDIQDHYGIPPENYWKPEYFEYDRNYFSGEIERFKKITEFRPGMTALDVGAGLGKCMKSLENAGFDVYGFEASESFHQMAIEKMNVKAEKLKLAMIENVDYEPNFFDFITFGAVLEHLYHPGQYIELAMKWLKPGGLMHIEVPSSDYLMHRFINFYFKLIGTNYVTNISPMHEPFHLFEFALTSFIEHSKKNHEYEISFHEYYVCSAEPFPRFTHPLLKKIMKMTDTGMQLAVWLKKL